ncbi:hypothetical protein SH584_11630 [Sphingomonas sp. LY29]|uniref:hypothetical protein n=1 Tax=Sphingomonas sp. LY29 TaxID=3095341 RepID=UPI002D791904|nr:hypothetical protein [Sphingomonas sp. LY29]WRP25681.1 hypothetical protein SH584_11630 [Sphingomonas sp. LY29]
MITFGGYSNDEHKASLVCRHVLSGESILSVFHDEDGDLHFSCGSDGHSVDDWQVVGLSHLASRLGALEAFPALPPETTACRVSKDDRWRVEN